MYMGQSHSIQQVVAQENLTNVLVRGDVTASSTTWRAALWTLLLLLLRLLAMLGFMLGVISL